MDARQLLPIDIELDEPCDPQMDAVAEIEEAAHRLDLETWIVNKLRHCERELTVNIPVVREDGSAATFTAFRVQHFTSRGPTIGAVSLSPTAHLSAMRAAAMNTTLQAALLDVPVGGAAGAIVCDPELLSERELHQLARDYVYGLRGMLGRHSDVLQPGAGCNSQIMAWMLDAYAQTIGRLERGTITGVPAALSGLNSRVAPIACGVIAILRHLLATRRLQPSQDKPHERTLAGQRIAVQGFGTRGSAIARALHNLGARVTAVADTSGAICNSSGIDVPGLQDHASKTGVVFGFPAAEACSNLDVLQSDCDVLIMAATERQINTAIAGKVKASVILEATRSAITHGAETTLCNRGIIIFPDMLTTAGALSAAHIEWKQAEQLSLPSAEEVEHEVERRTLNACLAVLDCSESERVTPRQAATLIALERIANELRLRK